MQDGTRQYEFTQLPECLVLTLNRFTYDAKVGRRSKLHTDVPVSPVLDIPLVPNVRPHAPAAADGSTGGGGFAEVNVHARAGENGVSPTEGESALHEPTSVSAGASTIQIQSPILSEPWSVRYVLRSIVVHSGNSPSSGHYFSYGLDQTPNGVGESWHVFNDSSVGPIAEPTIGAAIQRSSGTPYILCYVKVDGEDGAGAAMPVDPPLPSDVEQKLAGDNTSFIREAGQALARAAAGQFRGSGGTRRFDDSDERGGGGGGGQGFGGSGPGHGFGGGGSLPYIQ